ncbi:unnamed protein product [Macrosiphum euphorbiae]|uniref:DDE Tnp4 domain-containing protein n=1 Tax=Macrosiphum euphorbiae TaxID=13131 RepID=A0AAV0WDU9_9HEMI|nr:unnamed protein product [Macrosiphum euphorbiae]
MAEYYLGWELLELEERVRMLERRVERKVLRDTQNPYDLPINEFMNTFRVSPELAMYLRNSIRDSLQRERSSGLSVEIQYVMVNFYAKGYVRLVYYQRAGDNFITNVSQSSVSRCIHSVTNAINQKLLRRWVRFPMTAIERDRAREKFSNAPQAFEGAIGATDCTHINILAPKNHEEAYVNHHGNNFLNVQAVVDPELKILNINARFPGARNDSYIWSVSPIRRAMEFHYNGGDAGYPLEPWLLTPLTRYPEGTRQYQYTKKPCKARNIVERFFGVFKSMWRCLSYQRVLMYVPVTAGKIVNACAVIHNMRVHYRLSILPFEDCIEQDSVGGNNRINENNEIEDRRGPRVVAMKIQKQLMANWFPNYVDGDQ